VSKPSGEYPKVSQNLPEHRGGAVAANRKPMRSERPTRRASATLKRYKLEFRTEESSVLLGAGVPSSYAQ
jgi:hypothetical protein